MTIRGDLNHLDQQLDELEAEEARLAVDANPINRLRDLLRDVFAPPLLVGMADVEMRCLWGWWQVLRMVSDPRVVSKAGWRFYDGCRHIEKAMRQCLGDWVETAEGLPDDVDVPMPWNPVSPAGLYQLKWQLHCDSGVNARPRPGSKWAEEYAKHERDGFKYWFSDEQLFGAEHARGQIDHKFRVSPWSPEFNADPNSWPPEVIDILREADCYPPDVVPPFNLSEIGTVEPDHVR